MIQCHLEESTSHHRPDKGGVSLRLRSIAFPSSPFVEFESARRLKLQRPCECVQCAAPSPPDRPCQQPDAWVGPPSEGHTNIINLAPRDRPVLPPAVGTLVCCFVIRPPLFGRKPSPPHPLCTAGARWQPMGATGRSTAWR